MSWHHAADTLHRDPLRGLKLAVVISIGLHIGLFILAFALTLPKKVDHRFEYIETRMVRWAPKERPKYQLPHRNDPQPKQTEKAVALKPNPEKKQPAPETTKVEKPNTKTDYSKDINKILSKYQKKTGKKSQYAPDGSPDGSLDGELSPGAMKILGNAYLHQVSALFRAKWEIPALIGKDELARLECTIEFRVDASGKIVKVWIKTPSGDARFDASALAAVKKTAVLPLPSHPAFREQVLRYGMFYTFIPEDSSR